MTDLSVAAMTSGLSLDVAAGAKVTAPIILMFTGDSGSVSTHPVVLLRAGNGAQAVIAEWHRASVGLSAPVMAIDIADSADWIMQKSSKIVPQQRILRPPVSKWEKPPFWMVFNCRLVAVLARLEAHVKLSAEAADCRLSAIYLGRQNQHHDITTNMTHARGHCQSNQIIRGVLDGTARGVFQGKVACCTGCPKD